DADDWRYEAPPGPLETRQYRLDSKRFEWLKLAMGQSYCPNCGIPVQQNAVFCPNCDTKIVSAHHQPQQMPPGYFPPASPAQAVVSTSAYKAVIAVLLVIIILLGVGLFASSGHLFSFAGYRYPLPNPPNPQSTQPLPAPS